MASRMTELPKIGRFAITRSFSGMSPKYNIKINGIKNGLHMTGPRNLPRTAVLPLPNNMLDIDAAEMGRFSPLRARDISASVISAHYENHQSYTQDKIDVTVDSDPHVQSYDCRGALNLSSSMQSNVPAPFGGQHSILGMPGSQWGQEYKYLSEHLHSSHYLNLRESYALKYGVGKKTGSIRSYSTMAIFRPNTSLSKFGNSHSKFEKKTMSTETPEANGNNKPLSRKEQLKRAVAAYGSTVIVFHIAISLASLGAFYLLVSSGLDVMAFMDRFGFADGALAKKVTANAGTFVVAYAVHKVFAPVRIGITLTAAPFIVRYLRRIGILKSSKS